MVQEGLKLFALYDKLQELLEDGFDIFPSHLVIVKSKELSRIVDAFPDAIDESIKMAKMIIRNKEEILQDAKNKAERIIQEAQAERERRLNDASILRDLEEQGEAYKQRILQECENIKLKAFAEVENIRMTSREEALRMKEGAQTYAQRILVQLEQGLNTMFQEVKNGQQYIQELRTINEEDEANYNREQQRR